MTSIEIDSIALIKDLNLALRRDKSDQNMLVAWYENVGRTYGHKVNMKNLAMQIEDIELRTKALQALREYNRQGVALNEDLKVGDHSEIKAQIEKKRLEKELLSLERQIEQDKAAIRELQISKEKIENKEPAKSDFEQKIDILKKETLLQIQQMKESQDKLVFAKKSLEKIREEFGEKGEEMADELMRLWYEMGLFS